MAIRVVTEATGEPISTLDAKDHLRVSSSAEDVLIDGLVAPARSWAETYTRRAFMRQTVRYTRDRFPKGDTLELPRGPLYGSSTNVTVTYFPSTAQSTGEVLSSTVYFVDTESIAPRVVLEREQSWPTDVPRNANAVQVDFKAGYGLSSDVPAGIKHAMKLLVGHWYENREGVVAGSVAREVPFTVKSLLANYRVPNVP